MADASSRVSGGAGSLARASAGASALARAQDAATSSARADAVDLQLAQAAGVATRLSRIVTDSILWFVVATPGSDLLMLGSVFRVDSGTTAYVGPSGVSGFIEDVQVPVPALTVNELHCGCDEDPGTGSYTYTLMKNGNATGLTFTIAGTTRKGSVSLETAFASGDWLSLRVVATGDAPAAHHNASVRVTY